MTPDAARVVYLVNTLDVGGAEIGLIRLIDGGFFPSSSDVSIVALSAGGSALVSALEARAGSVSYSALTNRPLTIARALALVPKVYRLLRDIKPDVLVMSLTYANVVGRLAGVAARVAKMASFEHSTGLRREYLRPALWLTSPAISAVLYDCEATKSAASRYFVRPASRPWRRVPLFTLSSPARERMVRATPPYRVLTVARLETMKNLGAAIAAVGALRAGGLDVVYDIVGGGSLEAELTDQIRRLGLEAAVRLVGYRADWADLADRSDLYLQPSTREGACLSALEAMEFGLPIIGTPTGGLVEYAEAGHCIWLTDGFAPGDLAKAIEAVLGAPATRASLVRSGASFLDREYSETAVRGLYVAASQSLGLRGSS